MEQSLLEDIQLLRFILQLTGNNQHLSLHSTMEKAFLNEF